MASHVRALNEMAARLQIVEREKAAWRDRAIPAEAEVEKLRANLADAKEDRANAEAHAAKLLRRLADRDRLAEALREIRAGASGLMSRELARAALEGSAE